MKNGCRAGLAAILLLLTFGCGKKGAQLQSKAVPPDKTLFANAMEYLDKSQYIKARLSFQTLINAYPDSEFTPEAFFELGNTYYKEGGTEGLLQSEAQFKDFQLFYPTSERVAEAQFKIAAGHMRMMRQPERDASHTRKAEQSLMEFIRRFPDHELVPVANLYLEEVKENLATSLYKIAEYYNSKKFWKAAEHRYKQVIEEYPDFTKADESLFKLGQALELQNRPDEAAIYYSRLSAEYPYSEKVETARTRLGDLNKPIPPVDSAAAERHQRALSDDGFFILRPLKDFAAAMGLTTRGDPWQRALEMTAESRQAQMAAADAAVTEGQSADDIIISTTISKSADSPATAKTTVDDPAKKNDVKKDKKKPDKEKKP